MEPPRPIPNLLWRVGVTLPLDWGWSKNRVWVARAGSYGRRMNPEARAKRDALALILRAELGRQGVLQVARNVLWLRLHCALPNHRGDALNVLDLVADAVQDATGLDDRWYAVEGLTWELRPDRPELRVWVGQASLEDVKAGQVGPG